MYIEKVLSGLGVLVFSLGFYLILSNIVSVCQNGCNVLLLIIHKTRLFSTLVIFILHSLLLHF